MIVNYIMNFLCYSFQKLKKTSGGLSQHYATDFKTGEAKLA